MVPFLFGGGYIKWWQVQFFLPFHVQWVGQNQGDLGGDRREDDGLPAFPWTERESWNSLWCNYGNIEGGLFQRSLEVNMWEPDGPPASLKNSIVPSQLEVMSSGEPSPPHTQDLSFLAYRMRHLVNITCSLPRLWAVFPGHLQRWTELKTRV